MALQQNTHEILRLMHQFVGAKV